MAAGEARLEAPRAVAGLRALTPGAATAILARDGVATRAFLATRVEQPADGAARGAAYERPLVRSKRR